MITVLDIDQDFFFHPVVSGNPIDQEKDSEQLKQMHQIIDVKNVVKKFHLTQNIPGKVLVQHKEIFNEIKILNSRVNLIRLDAHHDMLKINIKDTPLQSANYVLHLVNNDLINEVIWVLPCKRNPDDFVKFPGAETLHSGGWRTLTHLKNSFRFKALDFYNMQFLGMIDYIFWTLSPEWCPQDSNLFQKFLNELIQPKN